MSNHFQRQNQGQVHSNIKLPDPNDLFRDPNYNDQQAKINEKDLQMLMNSRVEMPVHAEMPTDQLKSIIHDLELLKNTFANKLNDIEKRLMSLNTHTHAQSMPSYAPPKLPSFQLIQTHAPQQTPSMSSEQFNQQFNQQFIKQKQQAQQQAQQQAPNRFQPFRHNT